MSPIDRLTQKDLQTLGHSLKEAFANACEEQSIKWLEHAYRLNDGNPNLNVLFERVYPVTREGEGFYFKIINSVIAHALLHDPYSHEIYLETLWHHLKDTTPDRLNAFRKQLKEYCQSTTALTHETTRPEHLGLLYLITQGNVSSEKHYLTELIEVILKQKNSPEVLSALSVMGRLHPFSLEMVANAYTNQIMYKGLRLYTEDPDQMALLRVIYPKDDELLNSAARQLKFKISHLREEFIDLERGNGVSFSQGHLNDLIHIIKISLNNDNKRKFVHEIQESFEDLFLSTWRHDRIQATLHQVTPVLNLIINQLEDAGIDCRSIITRAFNTNDDGQYNGKTDYIESAADALLNSEEAPFKRYLAECAIKPMSTDEVLHHFKQRPDILAEIYKFTGNEALIVHMDHQARHASISHDLGL